MQPHERIRVEPVAAGAVPSIDQGDPHVGMAGDGIGECHARCPGPDHQVVRFEQVWHSGHSIACDEVVPAEAVPAGVSISGGSP
jgi:hypothetical protein